MIKGTPCYNPLDLEHNQATHTPQQDSHSQADSLFISLSFCLPPPASVHPRPHPFLAVHLPASGCAPFCPQSICLSLYSALGPIPAPIFCPLFSTQRHLTEEEVGTFCSSTPSTRSTDAHRIIPHPPASPRGKASSAPILQGTAQNHCGASNLLAQMKSPGGLCLNFTPESTGEGITDAYEGAIASPKLVSGLERGNLHDSGQRSSTSISGSMLLSPGQSHFPSQVDTIEPHSQTPFGGKSMNALRSPALDSSVGGFQSSSFSPRTRQSPQSPSRLLNLADRKKDTPRYSLTHTSTPRSNPRVLSISPGNDGQESPRKRTLQNGETSQAYDSEFRPNDGSVYSEGWRVDANRGGARKREEEFRMFMTPFDQVTVSLRACVRACLRE